MRLEISKYIKKMQLREKILTVVALGAVFFISLSEAISAIQDVFKKQEIRLESAINEVDLASAALFRFSNLKARQKSIEEAYKQVEIEGPVLSYLEKLLREKAGISSGFTIRDKPTKQFGGSYEQTPYTIRFTTVDINRFKDFLYELTEGPRPVVLASIDIKPKSTKDSLEVEMEISSIKRIKN